MENTFYLCTYVCVCSSMELLVQKIVCILYLHRIFIMVLYSHYEHYTSSCLKSIRHRSLFPYLFPAVVESLGCCLGLLLEIMTWPHLWAESQEPKTKSSHGSAFVPVTKSPSERATSVCTQQPPWGWPFFFPRLISKNGVFGISKCKLLYIGWINNKILLTVHRELYSVSMINHNGKEYDKEYM